MEIINKHSSSNLNKYQCMHPIAVNRIAAFSRELVGMMTLVKHSRILSLGCGEGFDMKNLLETGQLAIEYSCGLDLSHSSLKFSRQIISHFPFDVVNGDIQHLPLKLRRFDVILCLEVLEHLAFPEMVLKAISDSFNGFCLFSVPNEPLYRLTRMILLRKNIREWGNHPEHCHNWSKPAFSRLIEKYFVVDQVATPFPWTVILCHSNRASS